MEMYAYRIRALIPLSDDSPGTNEPDTADSPTLPDLTDFEVEATDGHIGRVDEASYEDESSCLVVDTGFWIFGKKRMIPAGAVERIDPNQRRAFVSMTKEQIKNAPDYDPARHKADEQGYHEEVGNYYKPHLS